MKRRTFLIGTGSTAIGGSALLGSGAFSRVESQRRAKIQVAKDPDAYLGLDGCPDSPNSSYTDITERGHLAIEMSPDNPTDAGGYGVNSDSRTWFHDVFQICNQGKQEVCIWIEDDENWPRVDNDEFDEDYSAYDGDRRVDFYLGDDPDRSVIGQENAVILPVGECVCIGLKTNTKGLKKKDQLLEDLDDEITIIADEECPPDIDPELLGDICGEKRLTEDAKKYFDVEDWEIQLYADPDFEQLLDTTLTDENGEYCFTGLEPGTYYVCEVLKPGTVAVYPEDGCQEVEVGEGETVEGVDFENDIEDELPVIDADHAISWISFCVEEGSIEDGDVTFEVTGFKDGDPTEPAQIEWESDVEVDTVTLFGGNQYWQFDGGFSGTATMGTGDDDGALDGQSSSSPCPDGSCGLKYNWNEDVNEFELDSHEDECNQQ